MKIIQKLWPGKATRKNTTSLSVIRMQALRALQIYLDVALKTPATITQLDIAVGKIEKVGKGEINVEIVDVMMHAFFFYEGRPKVYGREGLAPTPPKAMVKFTYAKTGNYEFWSVQEISGCIESEHLDYTLGGRGEVINDLSDSSTNTEVLVAIAAFDKLYNKNRPSGVLACVTDYIDWDVSSPWRTRDGQTGDPFSSLGR